MGRDKGVKVFYKNIDWVYGVRSRVVFAVLEYILFMTDRNSAEIRFNSNTRRDIAKSINASTAGVSKAMAELLSCGVLAKNVDEDGNELYNHFVLNPKMYWYGDLPQRKRAMKKYGDLFGY